MTERGYTGSLDTSIRRLTETAAIEVEIAIRERAERLAKFCESPIEIMLLAAMDFGLSIAEWGTYGYCLDIRKQDALTEQRPESRLLTIVPQYQWNSYRIDFAAFIPPSQDPAVFVECDGHEFHERTADQAERDRSRDRAIQHAGIPVLRFTGREIYRDPFKCGLQLFQFLATRLPHKDGGAA